MKLPNSNATSGVEKAELNHLREMRHRRWYHYLLLVPALLISAPYLVPSVAPTFLPPGFPLGSVMLYPRREIALLLGMAIGACLFGWFALAQCYALACHSISREFVGNTWNSLIASGVTMREIVLGKWRAVVRYLLLDFMLAALAPVALAYVVKTTDYRFHIVPQLLCRPLWGAFRPYCSPELFVSMAYIRFYQSLAARHIALSLLISALFWLAALVFTTAFCLWATLVAQRISVSEIAFAGASQLMVSIILIGGMISLAAWQEKSGLRDAAIWAANCNNGERYFPRPWSTPFGTTYYDLVPCAQAQSAQTTLRVSETLEVALMPLVDHGGLLVMNLMEPTASDLFALRMLISAVLGLGLQVGLALVFLAASTRLAQTGSG